MNQFKGGGAASAARVAGVVTAVFLRQMMNRVVLMSLLMPETK